MLELPTVGQNPTQSVVFQLSFGYARQQKSKKERGINDCLNGKRTWDASLFTIPLAM